MHIMSKLNLHYPFLLLFISAGKKYCTASLRLCMDTVLNKRLMNGEIKSNPSSSHDKLKLTFQICSTWSLNTALSWCFFAETSSMPGVHILLGLNAFWWVMYRSWMRGGLLIWPVRSPFMGPANKAKFYKCTYLGDTDCPPPPPQKKKKKKKNYNQTFSFNNFQNCELTWICFRTIKI